MTHTWNNTSTTPAAGSAMSANAGELRSRWRVIAADVPNPPQHHLRFEAFWSHCAHTPFKTTASHTPLSVYYVRTALTGHESVICTNTVRFPARHPGVGNSLFARPRVGPFVHCTRRHVPHVAVKSISLVFTAAMWEGVPMESKHGRPLW